MIAHLYRLRAQAGNCMQAYISSYTSHTKVDRLLFIADKCRGKPLELEALKLAATELQQVKALDRGSQQQPAGAGCTNRPSAPTDCTRDLQCRQIRASHGEDWRKAWPSLHSRSVSTLDLLKGSVP